MTTAWHDPDPGMIADCMRAWHALPEAQRDAAAEEVNAFLVELVIVEWSTFPDVRTAFATVEDFLEYRLQVTIAWLADCNGTPN